MAKTLVQVFGTERVRELLHERDTLVEHYWKSKTTPLIADRVLKMIDAIEATIAATYVQTI